MSLAAVFSLGSCSQEDLADVQKEDGVKLGIETTSITQSRSVVETSYLPDGAQMGVFLRESGKDTYDDDSYKNILYTATGTTSQTWGSTAAPELSNTSGNVYAYYPYTAGDFDLTAIPVDLSTGDVDFMYSIAPASVNYSNPEASLTMRHLCALIRITFKKGTYEGECILENVKIEGAGSTGTFNLLTNTYTPEEDAEGEIILENIKKDYLDLDFSGANGATVDFLVYPHNNTYMGNSSAYFPSIFFNFDGSYNFDYGSILSEPIPNFVSGKIYTIEVTIDRTAIRTKVGQVSVETWGDGGFSGEHTETI